MRQLFLIYKLPLIASVIFIFFIIGLINKLFFFFSKITRQFIAQRNTQWACFACTKLFNFKINYKISKVPRGSLLISNHLSYTDILVIASKVPTLFVTSNEMKNTPFLGWITQLGECLYVDRKSHKNLNGEVEIIQNTLNHGFNVLIFPEATTSDGVTLKPFRSSLLKVADGSSRPLYSYCLKYTTLNGKKMEEKEQTQIAWNDDKGFVPHVLMLMAQSSIGATLNELEVLNPTKFPDRKSLTGHLYQSTSKHYYSY